MPHVFCSDCNDVAGYCNFNSNQSCNNLLYNDASNKWGKCDATTDMTNYTSHMHGSNATGNVFKNNDNDANYGGGSVGGEGARRGEGSVREGISFCTPTRGVWSI